MLRRGPGKVAILIIEGCRDNLRNLPDPDLDTPDQVYTSPGQSTSGPRAV